LSAKANNVMRDADLADQALISKQAIARDVAAKRLLHRRQFKSAIASSDDDDYSVSQDGFESVVVTRRFSTMIRRNTLVKNSSKSVDPHDDISFSSSIVPLEVSQPSPIKIRNKKKKKSSKMKKKLSKISVVDPKESNEPRCKDFCEEEDVKLNDGYPFQRSVQDVRSSLIRRGTLIRQIKSNNQPLRQFEMSFLSNDEDSQRSLSICDTDESDNDLQKNNKKNKKKNMKVKTKTKTRTKTNAKKKGRRKTEENTEIPISVKSNMSSDVEENFDNTISSPVLGEVRQLSDIIASVRRQSILAKAARLSNDKFPSTSTIINTDDNINENASNLISNAVFNSSITITPKITSDINNDRIINQYSDNESLSMSDIEL
jgi:hypothetical protein